MWRQISRDLPSCPVPTAAAIALRRACAGSAPRLPLGAKRLQMSNTPLAEPDLAAIARSSPGLAQANDLSPSLLLRRGASLRMSTCFISQNVVTLSVYSR